MRVRAVLWQAIEALRKANTWRSEALPMTDPSDNRYLKRLGSDLEGG